MSYIYSPARGSTEASKRSRLVSSRRELQTDRDIREKNKLKNNVKINGPKLQIIDAYNKNNNIEDAYNVAKEINKKIGSTVYTKDIVDKWIQESNKKSEKEEEER